MQWICCQIGAREHYSFPRVLQAHNELGLLITDAWADKRLPWNLRSGTRAAERFHPDIRSCLVKSFDWPLIGFELSSRRRLSGWPLVMARNDWFQTRALSALRRFRESHPGDSITLFSYSYAAERLFQFAKESGWRTVLGQIDPGPFEEKIVTNLYTKAGRESEANPAPPVYWDRWRRECDLADEIIVNSEWSRHGLQAEGVRADKLHVVPLAYDPPVEASTFARTYPASFNSERPLRVLFLGQVNVRKGLLQILDAISRLADCPVEFWMVGDVQFPVSPEYRRHNRVKWFGGVARGSTASFYRDADVFLFPSLSDGFGLTQLEAQAWSLPVIASRRCGDVVKDGVNGYLLAEVTAEAIARTIESIVAAPAELRAFAARSRATNFRLAGLYPRLNGISRETSSCFSN